MFKRIEPIHVSDSRIPLSSITGRFIDCDSGAQNGARFCVSDGVTRDLTNGDEFKLPKNIKEIMNILKYYPQISELKEVAKMCTSMFTNSYSLDTKTLLEQINTAIKLYYYRNIIGNGEKPCDYLGKNYFGVTAAGGIIRGENLEGFNIGDSNIVLLDKYCNEISKSRDNVKDQKEDREKHIIEKYYPNVRNIDELWHDKEFRSWFRKTFTNSSSPYSFGVLNGEDKALDFINYYNFDLQKAHFILAYTDGFDEIMDSSAKRYKLLYRKEFKLKKEGTMVGYKRII